MPNRRVFLQAAASVVATAARHAVRVANHVDRDAVFDDLFARLATLD